MKKRHSQKKRMTGEERSGQIVAVATRLFSKKGFKGTTTREIAREAGISEAMIFRYFSGKDALYRAIIDSKCSDNEGQPLLLNLLEGRSGREIFLEVARFIISEHQRDPSFLRLLTYSALEGHNLSDMFMRTRGMEVIGFLEERIVDLIEDGVFRRMNPHLAALAFMGMVLHYSLSQEIYGMKRYLSVKNEDVINGFVDIFLEGMKRR